LFQAVFLLVPSIVTVSVVYKLGMLTGPAAATIASTIVGFSFAPIYYGVASTLVTDPLPAALAVLGIWFICRERNAWAGVALGLGIALKLIPAVLLVPALVMAASWKARWKLAIGCAIVVVGALAPFAVAGLDSFLSPYRWQASRPAWESMYAFVNWLVGAPHEFTSPLFEDLGFRFNFGWVFWGITPTLTSLTSPVPPSSLRWDNAVSILGTIVSLLPIAAAKAADARSVIRWSMYALSVTFFWSIGWSPQYELYIIPFAALAFESSQLALATVVALGGLTFLEYPLLFQWAYFYGGSAVWLAWGAMLGRYLLLGWLAAYVLRQEASLAALRARTSLLTRVARRPLLVGALAALPLLIGAVPAHLAASPCGLTRARLEPAAGLSSNTTDWSVPGGWFFSEAGEASDHGYTIADDDSAQMWSEFNRLGGWQVLGFPASRRFVWHGMLSQATQREILQWSPVTGQVEFANVLDLMHDQGRDDDLWRLKQIPPPLDVDEAGLPYETIAAHRLSWLEDRPAIQAAYCDAPGGADPLELWGLPMSRAVNMSDSGGEVYVLRTQRAAFQEWVGGAPWAAPGEVTVVLAGDLAKQFDLLPAEAVVPESAPPR
jgi:hypothetical protein